MSTGYIVNEGVPIKTFPVITDDRIEQHLEVAYTFIEDDEDVGKESPSVGGWWWVLEPGTQDGRLTLSEITRITDKIVTLRWRPTYKLCDVEFVEEASSEDIEAERAASQAIAEGYEVLLKSLKSDREETDRMRKIETDRLRKLMYE